MSEPVDLESIRCNISFELPEIPCLLPDCQHLFDMPYIAQWLENRQSRSSCPVCRTPVRGSPVTVRPLDELVAAYRLAEAFSADLDKYVPTDTDRILHLCTLALKNQEHKKSRNGFVDTGREFQAFIREKSSYEMEQVIRQYVERCFEHGTSQERLDYLRVCYRDLTSNELDLGSKAFFNALQIVRHSIN